MGFLSYIREHGKIAFVEKLISNEKKGIKCGVDGAYRHKPIEEIERLLRADD